VQLRQQWQSKQNGSASMTEETIQRSTFSVPQMDCSAEEQLIRLKLADCVNVRHLDFDLDARKLDVFHAGNRTAIESLLHDLNLGATHIGTEQVDDVDAIADESQQRSVLIAVLLINAALFLLEMITGLFAQSMGLLADSLDMLADAIVYGLSLLAVGKAATHKKSVARVSGYFQLMLALVGMIEVLRRFLGIGEEPRFAFMIVVSIIALAGNAASLLILQRSRNQEVHMQASRIFTTNDVLVNIGVMISGVLVLVTGSRIPDLVVGAIVFSLVGYGALRILRLAR
jgi:Co/Zn/Cd efflux system component